MRNLLLASAAALTLAACGQSGTPASADPTTSEASTVTPEQIAAESARLTEWFDAKYEEQLMFSPETLTIMGRPELAGQVDDRSFETRLEQLEWARAATAELEAEFDYDMLDEESQLSYDLWFYIQDMGEKSYEWRHHFYVFDQMSEAQAWPAQFLINYQNVETEEDVANYISRINGFAGELSTLLSNAQMAADMGIRAPGFAYEESQNQAEAIITGAPFTEGEDSALWADLKTKIQGLVEAETISQERADELLAEAEAALMGDFLTSYQTLISWFEEDIANTEDSFSLTAIPNGQAFYEYLLSYHTTTDMTADEIHELGLAEVERLREDMIAIKDEFGFEGSLQEFFVFLRETKDDERLYFPNTDEGRQGYIDAATADIDNIRTHIPEFFGILPEADVVVRRVEAFREQDGAAQHYFPPSLDGSRPGTYYAHLSDMTAMPKREIEVIAYHEAIPGHHMQIAISQELTDIPQFRTQQFFGAYTEGWALYSEWLATEMPGTYQDPLSEFGRLGSEMWRAIRLVVDTGMHARGWTREQGVEYFEANSAITSAQALSEIQRYLVMPGQATGYKVGMIFIQDLRKNAEEELGEDFDIRGFHDALLGGGSLPLHLLEVRVDNWIASVKAEAE